MTISLVLTSCFQNKIETYGKYCVFRKIDDSLTSILTIEGDNRLYTFESKLEIDIESLEDYGEFLKDKNKVYRKYDISDRSLILELNDVDKESFQTIGISIYARDNYHVFDSRNGLIDSADVNSFEIVEINNSFFGKDRYNYFFWNRIIKDTIGFEKLIKSKNNR